MPENINEKEVESAYEEGLKQLNGRVLGGSQKGCYFLMPLGISKEKADNISPEKIPKFKDLSENEKLAVSIIFQTIQGNPDLINLYPNILGEISILECELNQLDHTTFIKPAKGHEKGNSNELYFRVADIVQPLVRTIRRDGAPNLSLSVESPAIIVTRKERSPEQWQLEKSWFGGRPKLGKQRWPSCKGMPMAFLAQVDSASIKAVAESCPLPDKGSLAFFISATGGSAVVFVPDEDLEDFTPLPPDLPELSKVGGRTGYEGTADGERTFPFWPVELRAVELDKEMDQADAYEKAKEAVLDWYSTRKFNLSAKEVFSEDAFASRPQWWQTAIRLADILKAADSRTEGQKSLGFQVLASLIGKKDQAEDRKAFSLYVEEVSGWVKGKHPWSLLSEDEAVKLDSYISNALTRYRQFLSEESYRISVLEDLTILALATANDDLYLQIPKKAREAINQSYRLPIYGWNQMFGVPTSIQDSAVFENAGKHLLLQLFSDDMMCWEFGDAGICQFWISPENLEAQNWSEVNVTFEGS